ncbi:solute carrier family 28 member 3-like [Saccoglossus kowalevskii]
MENMEQHSPPPEYAQVALESDLNNVHSDDSKEQEGFEMKTLDKSTDKPTVMTSDNEEYTAVNIEEEDEEVENEENHPNYPSNCLTRKIDQFDRYVSRLCRHHKNYIMYMIYGVLLAGYIIYFAIALTKDFHRALALFIMTVFAVMLVTYRLVGKYWGDLICSRIRDPCMMYIRKHWVVLKWVVHVLLLVALVAFAAAMGVFHSIINNPQQLVSAFGIVVFILFSLLCSKRPGWVNWRTVFWGLGLQFCLGVIILRTSVGFDAFLGLGKEVQTFLSYADVGAEFVFSAPLEVHFFVFKVLPVIIFFSYILAMLYYLGVMQWITERFAWVMQYTMETSGTESLCAAANVFTGMTTAPLIIKPYLDEMTSSEIHAVLTSGYATIAGSVLGAYIAFGISASHLLSASVISAPAALAVSKIFYPELGRPTTLNVINISTPKRKEKNILEAATNGAIDGLNICANVTTQLIAIISTLAFINAVLSWLGSMVDHPELSFQFICSYVLYPVAWLMGVDPEDCHLVAELIGIKTFLNEFVAYGQLADYIKNRHAGISPSMSVRSEVIATYALCGFSNFGGIAVFIGGLAPLMPQRKAELAILILSFICISRCRCVV